MRTQQPSNHGYRLRSRNLFRYISAVGYLYSWRWVSLEYRVGSEFNIIQTLCCTCVSGPCQSLRLPKAEEWYHVRERVIVTIPFPSRTFGRLHGIHHLRRTTHPNYIHHLMMNQIGMKCEAYLITNGAPTTQIQEEIRDDEFWPLRTVGKIY